MKWWQWWLERGLLGWFVLTVPWALLTVVFDCAILWLVGVQSTISWQTQQAGRANPIIPFAMGFVAQGLLWHFFRIRNAPLFAWIPEQTAWVAVLGGVFATVAVELVWTQLGPQNP